MRIASRVSPGTRPVGKHLIGQQDVPQNNLQWLQIVIADIDQRGKEIVPMPDQIIETDHGDHRLRERQRHLEEKGEVRAAVHHRRLVQLLRQRAFEERPGDNQIEHVDAERDNEHPNRIRQMQILHQQVGRNKATVEEHRHHEQKHNDLPRPKLPPGQHIRGWQREQHVDQGAEQGVEHRIPVARPDPHILENFLVPEKADVFRKQPYLARRYECGIAEGSDHDEIQRINDNQENKGAQQPQRDLEGQLFAIEARAGSVGRRPGSTNTWPGAMGA